MKNSKKLHKELIENNTSDSLNIESQELALQESEMTPLEKQVFGARNTALSISQMVSIIAIAQMAIASSDKDGSLDEIDDSDKSYPRIPSSIWNLIKELTYVES